MRVTITERGHIVMGALHGPDEIGQAAAIARRLEYNAVVEPMPESSFTQVRLFRDNGDEYWGLSTLSDLTQVYAFTRGISINAAFEEIQADITKATGYPIDVPLENVSQLWNSTGT